MISQNQKVLFWNPNLLTIRLWQNLRSQFQSLCPKNGWTWTITTTIPIVCRWLLLDGLLKSKIRIGRGRELHGHCVQVVWTWAASWYSTTTGNLMVEPKATKDLGHHWHFPWHIRPFGTMHIRTWICPRICSMHGTYWYIVRTQHSKSVHQASLRGIHVWIL